MHWASHARCAILESIATMRAQNYAGSRIKSQRMFEFEVPSRYNNNFNSNA